MSQTANQEIEALVRDRAEAVEGKQIADGCAPLPAHIRQVRAGAR